MKVLIAYDGSDGANTMLDDLRLAGLPGKAEAIVLSVAEVTLPLPTAYGNLGIDYTESPPAGVEPALALARQAAGRIQKDFPEWELKAHAYAGSPAWEIINMAYEWKPRLVVLGSQGKSALGRMIFGSVSQKVATEAPCSVRVSRGRVRGGNAPVRIIICLDGSPYAAVAVKSVAARLWPEHTEVWLVTAIGPSFNGMEQIIEEKSSRAQALHEATAVKLRATGLDVSTVIKDGGPKRIILDEAETVGADCIFLGTRGLSGFHRSYLGSVSTAVVARAHCSVEIARTGAPA
jgi:nucleotide-binding universal stress UspA family protein